jgi:hypothetical protein
MSETSVRLNQQAEDTAARMRADMRNTIEQYVGYDENLAAFLDDLVRDGMHPVDFLIIENDMLVEKLAEVQDAIARIKAGLPRG